MHARALLAVFFSVLAVSALPTRRDDDDVSDADADDLFSQIEAAASGNSGAESTIDAELSSAAAAAQPTGTMSILPIESAALSLVQAALGTQTQITVLVAQVSGTPHIELSSIGGPAITLAESGGVPTSFAGHTFTAIPNKNAAAAGMAPVLIPAITGVASMALLAVAGGAFVLL
ncbi:hypothetical protein C8Q80DRAFT_11451 [Daedaleopsis nitida]|nr:hypothetical protein C8Q80DRAFT_11451 [Daedaleopsis nitida]